ncbi:MAG TPA: sigma-70 family RNA polymerase sigma factor [Longimicrobiaceae bacterium]|jgi:RNA polymerase sigma-70 factor (ECF subfamily)|nr:sigma-70 family RNA polymerase sigma factor [Longimicrobiaceae bacterium]
MEPERALVERVLAGDGAAFRDLVARYQRLVSHVVGRMVRDERDREELCQDVFFRVHRKLGGFGFQSKLSTWIASIAYRACLSHLQKKRMPLFEDLAPGNRGHTPPAEVRDLSPEWGDEMAAREMRGFVREQVDGMPMPYRAVLTFYHLEEMSVGEVSQVMGLPAGTVKSYLFRGRKALKDRLLTRYSAEELRP